jgi:hypothetical protein
MRKAYLGLPQRASEMIKKLPPEPYMKGELSGSHPRNRVVGSSVQGICSEHAATMSALVEAKAFLDMPQSLDLLDDDSPTKETKVAGVVLASLVATSIPPNHVP